MKKILVLLSSILASVLFGSTYAAQIVSTSLEQSMSPGYQTVNINFDEPVVGNDVSLYFGNEVINALSFTCVDTACSTTLGDYYGSGTYNFTITQGAFFSPNTSNISQEFTGQFIVEYPPITLVSSSPEGTITNGSNVQLTFDVSESVSANNYSSTISLYKNGEYYGAIPSYLVCYYSQNCSYTVGSMPDGDYEVYIPAGTYMSMNGQENIDIRFYFSIQSPRPKLISSAPNGTVTNGYSVNLEFDLDEPVYTGNYSSTIDIYKDTSYYASISAYSVCYYTSHCTYTMGSLSDGYYEVRIPTGTYTGLVTYMTNNELSYSFSVETPKPGLDSSSPSGTHTSVETLNLEFSWSEMVYVANSMGSIEIQKDGQYYTNFSIYSMWCNYMLSCSYSLGTFPDGVYEVVIPAGLYASTTTYASNDELRYNFTIDTPRPSLVASSPNNTITNGTGITIGFTWSELVNTGSNIVSLYKDGSFVVSTNTLDICVAQAGECSWYVGDLGDGSYEVLIPENVFSSVQTGTQNAAINFSFAITTPAEPELIQTMCRNGTFRVSPSRTYTAENITVTAYQTDKAGNISPVENIIFQP